MSQKHKTKTVEQKEPYAFQLSKLLKNFDSSDERKKDSEEEILNTSHCRLAIKPIDPTYQNLWSLYKKQMAAFWTAEEIDFSNDGYDFMKLDTNAQHYIKRILAFFAGSDTIVNINIKKKFTNITVKEAEVAYGYQQMMENIHGEVYADMLLNIVKDTKEQNELINAFKNIDSIRIMTEWAQQWIDTDRRIAFSIVAFCIFEGLMFSGAFASIYWLKKTIGEDKMKGLVQSNLLIARDEGLHTNFGCLIYSFVKHKLTNEEMNEMISDAVNICKLFNTDAIRVDMIGMNITLMHNYIEYIADRLLVALGYNKLYNTPIPDQFQFMDAIFFVNKNNFFERRTVDYSSAYNETNNGAWEFKILNEY